MKNGIYFNLTEDDYHALNRLSASGMKNMLISVPTFWAKSWMNKDKPEDDGDKEHLILGRAYHTAIFEPERMNARFAGEPNLDGIDGILTTDTMVKAELKALGEAQTKAGEVSVDRARRLRDLGFKGQIKSLIDAEFEAGLNGRQAIKSGHWAQILQDIDRIAENPEIQELVSRGSAEVTILWTCPETGIDMKARIDKLASDRFVDLKSFANANGKPVNQAIIDQVQYNRYYLSMRNYQHAIAAIGECDLQIMDDASETQIADIETLRGQKNPLEAWLFFQEKSGIPNLLVRHLRLNVYPEGYDAQAIASKRNDFKVGPSVLARKADIEIQRAKVLFKQACEVYGTDGEPWFPFDMLGQIGDDDFNPYFLDTMPA